jgi:hypothetical protein
MKPVGFRECTRTLGPPRGQTDVDPLPIWDDGKQLISKWKMSWAERLSALLFGTVWLQVRSSYTQPPVALTVTRQIFERRERNESSG